MATERVDPANPNPNIRAEMARAGLTQAGLAGRIGMSQAAVSRRLTGDTEWTIGELTRAAAALGCPLSALVHLTSA